MTYLLVFIAATMAGNIKASIPTHIEQMPSPAACEQLRKVILDTAENASGLVVYCVPIKQ